MYFVDHRPIFIFLFFCVFVFAIRADVGVSAL